VVRRGDADPQAPVQFPDGGELVAGGVNALEDALFQVIGYLPVSKVIGTGWHGDPICYA
jgi:hypothetical protein